MGIVLTLKFDNCTSLLSAILGIERLDFSSRTALFRNSILYFSAHATANVAKPSVLGEDDEPIDTTQHSDDEDNFWVTSQGKFRFKMEELPPHLQVIYTLLNVSNVQIMPITAYSCLV